MRDAGLSPVAALPVQADGRAAAGRAPRLLWIMAGHNVATLLYASLLANITWLVPLLVRLRFGAGDAGWKDWQTALVTAALPTSLAVSIFWAELLRRLPIRVYVFLFWFCTAAPIACMAFVQNFWQLFGLHLLACIGTASWTPLNGQLLRHFYADGLRGRAYAVQTIASLGGTVFAVFLVGRWMESNPDAFRYYLPLAGLFHLAGMAVLYWLARAANVQPEEGESTPRAWADLVRPVLRMGAVLRQDRVFARYEAAFMTYGAAFMICEALLPILGTAKLGMGYEDYAHSTQMLQRFATLLVILPMGVLLDRIGAVRLSAMAFGLLAFYPLLLLAAGGPAGVGLASGVFGVAMGAVVMGWMLGPVALAGSPEKAGHYVGIHATLVGVRGVLFHGLAMLTYKLTDSLTWPLLAAAFCFLWAAWQMRKLRIKR